MQDKVEAFTKAENDLLTYLFCKYRDGCYDEIGAENKGSWEYENALGNLRLLSEIERKLEVVNVPD